MCEPPRSLGERGGGRMLMVPITGGTVAGATHMVAAQQEILQGTDVGLALVVRTYPIAK